MRPSASAPWSRPVTISAPGANVFGFVLRIDREGEATVVWNDGYANNPSIESNTLSVITGRWTKPQILAATGYGGVDSQLAVSGRGDALVTSQRQVSETGHRRSVSIIHYAQMRHVAIGPRERTGSSGCASLRAGSGLDPHDHADDQCGRTRDRHGR